MDFENEDYVTENDHDRSSKDATSATPNGLSVEEQLELFAEILIDQLLSERDGKK
jgi:hypothetical protein